MSIIFGEDHEIFRNSVRTFVEKEIKPYAVDWDEKEEFPKEIFKKLGDLGFLGIKYPEEYGGSGLDYSYETVFVEEMARCDSLGLLLSILVQTDMASPAIYHFGTEEQKKRFLAPALKGEKVLAIGITEPGAGSDVANIKTTARREGDYYVINGSKTFITNGAIADYITLAVKTDPTKKHKGISLIMFDTSVEGFSVGKHIKKMGNWASNTAELFFDDCKIPAENLLGEENMGFYYIMKGFETERLSGVIMGYAAAQYAIDVAVNYAKERTVFDKRVIDFQVIRHKLVELITEVDIARQYTYGIIERYNKGENVLKEITMAKYWVGEMVIKVANEALQILGGYGYTREFPIERILRDARLYTIGGGTTEVMKEILSKELK